MGGALSLGAGLVGAIGSIFGKPSTPKAPTLPGVQGAANSTLSGIGGLTNVPQQLYPQYQGLIAGLQANPYSTMGQQGANTAAGIGANTAGGLYGLSQSLIPYAQQIGQTAFDPQSALYSRTLQQLQDQTRVGEAARGTVMSPYGAGQEADNLRNFNIDWQNNLLNRMISGGSALSGLGNSIGQFGQNAAQLYGQSALLPYQTFMGMGQDQLGLLNTLSQAGLAGNQVPQQQIQDYLNYLQAANQAQGAATQAGVANWDQQQALGQGLTGSLANIGSQWSNIPLLSNLFGGNTVGTLSPSMAMGTGFGGLY